MATQTYALTGVRDFDFPFPVRYESQITVEVRPGGVVPPAAYEVIGYGPQATGVTIRYPDAPVTSEAVLVITRYVMPERAAEFPDDRGITARALNTEFDNVYMALIDFSGSLSDRVDAILDVELPPRLDLLVPPLVQDSVESLVPAWMDQHLPGWLAVQVPPLVASEFRSLVDAMGGIGYQFVGDYAPGIEITEYNQLIRSDGEFWRLSASENLPYTTTGAGMPEDGAFVAVGDATLRQEIRGGVRRFDTTSDLTNVVGRYPLDVATVSAYREGRYGEGGEFVWDADSVRPANGGTVFGHAAQGRWKRVFNSRHFPVAHFGIFPDGTDCRAKLIQVIEWANSIGGANLIFDEGVYTINSGSVIVPSGYAQISLVGQGAGKTILDFSGNPETAGGISVGHLQMGCKRGVVSDLTVDAGLDPFVQAGGIAGVRFFSGSEMRAERLTVKNVAGPGIVTWGGFSGFVGIDCYVENASWGIMIGAGSFSLVRPRTYNTVNDGVTMRFGAGPGVVFDGHTKQSGHSGFSVTNGRDIRVIGCLAEDVPPNPGVDAIEAGFECESRDATSERVQFIDCTAINTHTGFVFRERDGNSGIFAHRDCRVVAGIADGCTNGIVIKDSGERLNVESITITDCTNDIIWREELVPDVAWGTIVGDTAGISSYNVERGPNGSLTIYRTVQVDLTSSEWQVFMLDERFENPLDVAISWSLVNEMGPAANQEALASLFFGVAGPTPIFRARCNGQGESSVTVRVMMTGRWKP